MQVFTVESKKAATFTLQFHPAELGSFSHELQLRVKLNPFEQYRVAVTGALLSLLHAAGPARALHAAPLSTCMRHNTIFKCMRCCLQASATRRM